MKRTNVKRAAFGSIPFAVGLLIATLLTIMVAVPATGRLIAQGNGTEQQQVAITQTVGAAFQNAVTATAAFQNTVGASFNKALTSTAQVAYLTATPVVQNQGGSVSFKTPEDAVTVFMQGVAQNDVSKILQACAINEMAEKFRFDLYTARIQALVPYQSQAPSDYPWYAEMNKAQLSWQILSQVRMFAFGLLSTEDIASGRTIIINPTTDAGRIPKFTKDVDPARLANIQVKQIGLPNKNLLTTRYQDNATKLAHVYGADESTERVALFSFEGNYYFEGFTILRYGDNWKIMSATSPMAGLNVLGVPNKTTEQDFANMIH